MSESKFAPREFRVSIDTRGMAPHARQRVIEHLEFLIEELDGGRREDFNVFPIHVGDNPKKPRIGHAVFVREEAPAYSGSLCVTCWTLCSADGTCKRCDLMERLAEYLTEAHEADINDFRDGESHAGDGAADCSYCQTSADALVWVKVEVTAAPLMAAALRKIAFGVVDPRAVATSALTAAHVAVNA